MLIVTGVWHSGCASDSRSRAWAFESFCPPIRTETQLLIHIESDSCSSSSRGYGATAAHLTPDQKVGSSNLSALIFRHRLCSSFIHIDSYTHGVMRGYSAAAERVTLDREFGNSSLPWIILTLRLSCSFTDSRTHVHHHQGGMAQRQRV